MKNCLFSVMSIVCLLFQNLVLLLFPNAWLFTAKEKSYSTLTSTTENYFPLEVGQTWRYRWWNDTYETNDIIDSVTLTHILEGEDYQAYVVSTHYWSHEGFFSLSNNSDGVYGYFHSSVGGSMIPAPMYYAYHFLTIGSNLLVRYPIIIGDHWTGSTQADGYTFSSSTDVIGFETVSVLAGTYQALHTQTTITNNANNPTWAGTRDAWYANNVGLVKLVFHHNSGSITTIELDTKLPPWPQPIENPVLKLGSASWENYQVHGPSVLFDTSTEKYQMWYTGITSPLPGSVAQSRIGYATSDDGINWTRMSPEPVLPIQDPQIATEWDAYGTAFPTVLKKDGQYIMWYSGVSATSEVAIGLATSPDGLVWTKYTGNPVLTRGSLGQWDSDCVRDPTVIYQDGLYRMWYANNSAPFSVGYATSPDGITWTKFEQNPVFGGSSASEWDHMGPMSPSVFYDDASGRYELWYAAYQSDSHSSNRIGRAFSLDGVIFTRDTNNPILFPQNDYRRPTTVYGDGTNHWEAYDIYGPSVVLINAKRYVFYGGTGQWGYQIGLTFEPYQTFIPIVKR